VFRPDHPGLTSDPEAGGGGAEATRAIQPIPGAELARLRKWDLEPNVVANLTARAVGLSSPAAPPEGDLAPRATGWLIGTGSRHKQLYPNFARWAEGGLLTASLYINVIGLADLHKGVLLGGLIIGGPFLSLLAGIAIVPGALIRRQFKLAQRVASLEEAPSGTLVCVAGAIAPQATVPTLFRGVPAVLFRNRIGTADETRGQDFLLDLDQGGQAKVAARRSFLLDPPRRTREPPACGPVSDHHVEGRSALQSDLFARPWLPALHRRYESSVGPGDRVEVCGLLEHVLDPAMERRSPREPAIRPVLMAGEKTPLLVRRV
jgi:hypothetical protein